MTQENKELLLKDLCVRLPHKTYVKTTKGIGYVYAINTSQLIELSVANDSEYWSEVFNIDEIKPYLRPMSSMTTDEEYEYHQIRKRNSDKSLSLMDCSDHLQQLLFPIIAGTESICWLNKYHFDYRGLIPKGLAIEVTEENNPYKE